VTRWTTISQNGVVVHTVEHVLSALHGLGVDNLLIELDGSETPVGDGSALPWVRLIEEAGLQPQEGVREVYQPREMLQAQLGDSLAVVLPAGSLAVPSPPPRGGLE